MSRETSLFPVSRTWLSLHREQKGIHGSVYHLYSVNLSSARELYEKLDYSIADVEQSAGGPIALSSEKVDVLMGRMREPSLSLHGIEGAFYGVGAKTVIPAKVCLEHPLD
jgi:hypothetical protein